MKRLRTPPSESGLKEIYERFTKFYDQMLEQEEKNFFTTEIIEDEKEKSYTITFVTWLENIPIKPNATIHFELTDEAYHFHMTTSVDLEQAKPMPTTIMNGKDHWEPNKKPITTAYLCLDALIELIKTMKMIRQQEQQENYPTNY